MIIPLVAKSRRRFITIPRAERAEAAASFVAADAKTVEPLVGTSANIYLPAFPGCFVGTVVGGRSLTAQTYIYGRMRIADQARWPKAPTADATVALALWGRTGGVRSQALQTSAQVAGVQDNGRC